MLACTIPETGSQAPRPDTPQPAAGRPGHPRPGTAAGRPGARGGRRRAGRRACRRPDQPRGQPSATRDRSAAASGEQLAADLVVGAMGRRYLCRAGSSTPAPGPSPEQTLRFTGLSFDAGMPSAIYDTPVCPTQKPAGRATPVDKGRRWVAGPQPPLPAVPPVVNPEPGQDQGRNRSVGLQPFGNGPGWRPEQVVVVRPGGPGQDCSGSGGHGRSGDLAGRRASDTTPRCRGLRRRGLLQGAAQRHRDRCGGGRD
jgi:hypothetical protein